MVTTRSFLATFTPDGDLHIPDEAKAVLELKGVNEVAIISDETGIHLIPLKKTLYEIRGSAKSDRVFSEDFDMEIEEAMDEALRDKYR